MIALSYPKSIRKMNDSTYVRHYYYYYYYGYIFSIEFFTLLTWKRKGPWPVTNALIFFIAALEIPFSKFIVIHSFTLYASPLGEKKCRPYE